MRCEGFPEGGAWVVEEVEFVVAGVFDEGAGGGDVDCAVVELDFGGLVGGFAF